MMQLGIIWNAGVLIVVTTLAGSIPADVYNVTTIAIVPFPHTRNNLSNGLYRERVRQTHKKTIDEASIHRLFARLGIRTARNVTISVTNIPHFVTIRKRERERENGNGHFMSLSREG